MKEVLWIQKYRQQIFALEILVAILFGPVIANSINETWWTTIGLIISIFLILEISIYISMVLFAKAAHSKTQKVHDKTQEAHKQIKKEYGLLTNDSSISMTSSKKKKRKPKGKKTHKR